MGRHLERRTGTSEESHRPRDALLGVTPPLALLALPLNGLLMLYASWVSDWTMAWVFGIFGIANAVVMFMPLWWRKVDSRRASAIMLVAIFAGWIANGFLALRYALGSYGLG
jgi:hypothetical protein